MGISQDELVSLLKEKGLKVTTQRKEVLDVLLENEGKHLSPEEIYNSIKLKNPEIGLATVYRTLILLDSMEVIYKIDLDDNCARYELNRNKEDHRHHHLICTVCGKVQEVEEDLLESLESEIKKKKNFTVHDHRVKFYGICGDCAKKDDRD
jgi:Fe2+/Zn2+ uptake regulation proteins